MNINFLLKKSLKWSCALFLFLGLFIGNDIIAQNGIVVGGTINDDSGQPLPGVNILEKGTNNGVSTDFDGKYTINVSSNSSILIISYVGFQKQEINVDGKNTINVVLKSELNSLDEVVVVGYGTVKKSDVTGSVVSVGGETIAERKVTNPIEGLQGSLPGVVITQKTGRLGDGFSVNIRGTNSFNSTQPLYIVDGIQTGGIDFLNPNDIARIDVLKDASSAAIYGSRGASGVIIVTTKSGTSAKSGINVSVESSFGTKEASRLPDMMDGAKWWAYHQSAYLNSDAMTDTPEHNLASAGNNSPELIKRANSGYSFDWYDAVLQTGIQLNNYVAINGRSESGLAYNIGLGVQNETGILDKESIDKYTFKSGITQNIGDKITTGVNLSLTHSMEQLGSDVAMQEAFRLNPLTSPWAVDANGNELVGELWLQPGKLTYPDGSWAFNKTSTLNPLVEIKNSKQEIRRWKTIGNVFLEYKALDWLSFKTTLSTGLSQYRTGEAYGPESNVGIGANQSAVSSINNYENFNYTWDNQFNINYAVDEHVFNFLGLQSFYSNRTETSYLYSKLQPFETDWYNIGSGDQTTKVANSNFSKNTLSSYAVRLNYSYKDKYLLTASNRWDGSSVLSEGNKWEFFPSVALAWKVSDEAFMENNDFVSNLKARASIGYTGNDNVGAYTTLNNIPTQTYYDFDGTAANGWTSNSLANKALGWEKTRELNFGIDYGILNNRIAGSIDVYDRLSEDLIVNQVLPIESGSGSTVANVGSISNKGFELSLITRNIQTEKISWETSFTFTKNTNKLESIYGQDDSDDIGNNLFLGENLHSIYNYVFDGVWQESEAAEAASYNMKPGEARPKDLNGDGKFDADNDRKVLGNSDPDWSGSFTSNLKYGNWDLFVNVITSQGVYVMSSFHDNFADVNDRGRMKLDFDNWFVPTNGAGLPVQASNENPRPRFSGAYWGSNFAFNKDASFVKVKNIAVGYTLNDDVLSKLNIKSCRIYANVLNPFVFTEYDGWDPEWAAAGLGVGRPSSTTYQLGLSLKL